MKNNIFLILLTWILPQLGSASTLSLIPSDGTALEFRSYQARIVLNGFFAFTELELIFYNSEHRQREGRFQIVLPQQAAISRFAMQIGNHLQEGEMVERQSAQQVYEDFLHRRQDPALLEVDQGNRFNARIFPIEALSEKRLILSYSQRLQGDYLLPLQGLPQLEHFRLKVFYDNHYLPLDDEDLTQKTEHYNIYTEDKNNYQPTEDFKIVHKPEKKQEDWLVMQAGEWVAARIVPLLKDELIPIGDTLVVLVDTSASQAPSYANTCSRLASLLPLLKSNQLILYTFDQSVTQVGQTETLAEQPQLLAQLKHYQPLGASRLDNVLFTLKQLPLTGARLLIVSDTVITAGETSATQLMSQLKTIPWLNRVDVLLPSYYRDESVATTLVTAGQVTGKVIALTDSLADTSIVQQLIQPVYTDIALQVTDSMAFWPRHIKALQANEPVMILAQKPLERPLEISVSDGKQFFKQWRWPTHQFQAVEPLLLQREWHRTQIETLLARLDKTDDKAEKQKLRQTITDISVHQRILSPYTALLVLETEQDYRRYDIDRHNLKDILTVGNKGMNVLKRSQINYLPYQHANVQFKERIRPIDDDDSESSLTDSDGDGISDDQDHCPHSVDKNVQYHGPSIGCAKEPVMMAPMLPPNWIIPFAPGKAILSSERKKMLEEILEQLNSRYADNWAIDSIRIESYTDDRNQGNENILLALKRAQVVSDYLIKKGFSATLFQIQTHVLPVKQADQSCNGNRCVEVHFYLHQRPPPPPEPWIGRYAEFRALLEKKAFTAAGELAQRWHQEELADVMALIALGEWYEHLGDSHQASRVYGSLIDYFPGRVEMRRWAAERLLAAQTEIWLSIDALQHAIKQRPDHPSSYYLLAIAYWQAGFYHKAIELLETTKSIDFGRYQNISKILTETQALMLTYLQQNNQLDILFPQQQLTWTPSHQSQLRLVLIWETDANNVDIQLYDNQQQRVYSDHVDARDGYGPEWLTITEPHDFPYQLQAHYSWMGPMGYSMGMIHILRFEPHQGLISTFKPFVIMQNNAFVSLGQIEDLSTP